MIVLCGATGYTGGLVCDELVRRGLDFALGGRNEAKLEALPGDHWPPRPRIPRRRLARGGRRRTAGELEFPAPIGRQAMASYPSGETITVPRHTRTRSVRTLITARTFVPAAFLAPAFPVVLPGISLALRAPLRSLLDRAIKRLPEGPAPEARRKNTFTIVAVARGADGRERRGTLSGHDGYGLTAVMLVDAVERPANESYAKAGAMGSAVAFDPAELVDGLAGFGLRWEIAPEPAAMLRAAAAAP